MKENHLKRLLSFVLVIAMVVSLCPTIAFAGDTLPYRGESALADNEPTSHGYRAEDLLSWDPATDPDAELLRARVPLQNRIEAVAATQANPSLNPEVKYLTLAGDYGNAFFGGTSYTNEFSEYCFNFWQYIDYYAPWHGQTTATTPMELWNVDDERVNPNAWKSRSFEFGMMNLPNAAYTNAAHKNGVLSLGCIFLPRAYQSWRTLIQRDENGGFPYADKLIEITKYYGFDGWYMNLEGSDSPSGTAKEELAAFLKYLRDEGGLYVQYYNAGGSIIKLLLAPATAVLALNIYQQRAILKRNFWPVVLGCFVGSLVSMLLVQVLCRLFQAEASLLNSLLPKSVTTAIAVSIAESSGGLPALTAASVIITGIEGAMLAPLFAKVFHVTDPVVEGVAIGACSHAVGTSKALEIGPLQGAMSSIALCVCGIITSILAMFFTA